VLRLAIYFGLVLSLATRVIGQSTQISETLAAPPARLTLTQLASTAKAYLRDSAEFPLKIQLKMIATNNAGRTIKSDRAYGSYDFHGYNPRSETGKANLRIQTDGIFHSAKGMLPAAWNTSLAGLEPATMLQKNAEEKYSLEISDSSDRNLLIATMTPIPGWCSGLKWSVENSVPASYCGTSKFALHKDDLGLQHFSFDAVGLPLQAEVKPFGPCEIRRYHTDVDFQKVMLPGDPKPFLVPKHTEVTIETDKGKLFMTADFAPRK
jgi:hypothetical protein